MSDDRWETVWTFYTKRFVVRLAVADEEREPDFDDPEDMAFAQEGGWAWCQTRVQVVHRDTDNPKNWAVTREMVLGEDYLGGCSYKGLDDFRQDAYFRDMVRRAIDEARDKVARIKLRHTQRGV